MPFSAPVAREAVEYYDGKEHPTGREKTCCARFSASIRSARGLSRSRNELRTAQSVGWCATRITRRPPFPPRAGRRNARRCCGRSPASRCRSSMKSRSPIFQRDAADLAAHAAGLPRWLRREEGCVQFGRHRHRTNSRRNSPRAACASATRGRASTFYQGQHAGPAARQEQEAAPGALLLLRSRKATSIFSTAAWRPSRSSSSRRASTAIDKDFKNPYGYNLEKGATADRGSGLSRRHRSARPASRWSSRWTCRDRRRGAAARGIRAAQFEQLGIKVRIIENTFARLHGEGGPGQFPDRRRQRLGRGLSGSRKITSFLFYSEEFSARRARTSAATTNPEFDQLFEKMATMENSPERLALVHSA